jgi:5-methylcytosine-specific restriction protein A
MIAAKTFSSLKRGQYPLDIKKHTYRLSAARRGYGSKWQRARQAFLGQHPLCECEECRRTGRILIATVVDHIKPHKGDMKLFWDRDNWMPMAKQCHDVKTAKHDGGFGNSRGGGGQISTA